MVDMPWINSYPDGVRWDAKIVPGPVQQILEDAVAKWSDRPAISFMGKRLTCGELGRLTDRAARGLITRTRVTPSSCPAQRRSSFRALAMSVYGRFC
jgi:hypothetical protein